jgi:hypothetical protein
MRARGLLLAAAFCLAASAHPQAAKAQDMSQVFGLRACNASDRPISMALSAMISPSNQRYHVFGWYTLNPGCSDTGYFPRPWLYYYAEDLSKGRSYRVWRGNFPLCVAYPGPFDWVHATGVTCSAEELKQFTETRVDPSVAILVVTFQ